MERRWLEAAKTAVPDHYRTLGVKVSDEETTIRYAFKALALRYHPDKAGTAVEKTAADRIFRLLSEASQTLGSATLRASYDKSLPNN